MKCLYLLLVAFTIASAISCSRGSNDSQSARVTFSGGYETDPRDRGRPVVLIASALDVSSDVFRSAFSGVTPAKGGPPSPGHARANKKILMDALGKHGVTNERLDEVSNFYRYRRESGEVWKCTAATATAIIEDGKVTGFNITNAGAGYSTPPIVKVHGFDNLKVKAIVEFSTDIKTNGRVSSLTVDD